MVPPADGVASFNRRSSVDAAGHTASAPGWRRRAGALRETSSTDERQARYRRERRKLAVAAMTIGVLNDGISLCVGTVEDAVELDRAHFPRG